MNVLYQIFKPLMNVGINYEFKETLKCNDGGVVYEWMTVKVYLKGEVFSRILLEFLNNIKI